MRLHEKYLDSIKEYTYNNSNKQSVYLTDLLRHSDSLLAELVELESDYKRCVSKFAECVAMLGMLVIKKGMSAKLPKSYKGDWHEYLIENLQE